MQLVKLNLNTPDFIRSLLELDKSEWNSFRNTLKKITQLTWQQVYQYQGLKWEKITSTQPPPGIETMYSFRFSQSRRATACREGDYMRMILISPDHDATYGKK